MQAHAFAVLSMEHFNSPRRARKQLLYKALLGLPAIKEMLYVDAHRHWWRAPSNRSSPLPKLRVWQGVFLFPGERLAMIRRINRQFIYAALKTQLAAKSRWHTVFYNPWDVPLARHLSRHGPVWFDWTDDWKEYYGLLSIGRAQEEAVRMASGVIAVSELLRDRAVHLRGSAKKVLLLPNATAWTPTPNLDRPVDITHIPSPRLGFVGHIGPWFDIELVLKLSDIRPEWQWILVGSIDSRFVHRLKQRENIHLLGQRPYDTLQAYMAHCDVLVAPYRPGIEGDATKLYDYLTIGLPIVSARLSTAIRLRPHVDIASDVPSWIKALNNALHNTKPGLRLERQEEIRKHTWHMRACTLLNWLTRIHGA